ncbi:MAG: HNH endonuclease [Treponema sp.]
MIKTLCIFPGCGLLAETGHRYCKKHLEESQKKRQEWEKENRKPFRNAKRTNTAFYNTTEWRKLRKQVLETYGNKCFICGKTKEESGYPLEIHHKIPPKGNKDLFFDLENCIVLCKICHAKITQKENEQRHN